MLAIRIVVEAILSAIIGALASTYSRAALVWTAWSCLVVIVALNGGLAWLRSRDVVISTLVAALVGASIGGGAWLVFVVAAPIAPKGVAKASQGLVLDINQAQFSEVTSPQGEKIPLLSLVASVRNTGTPTVAEGYEAFIRLADGRLIATEPIEMPAQMTLGVGTSQREVVFSRDALYTKTITPVQPGAVVRGRLLYFVRGWTLADLNRTLGGASIKMRYMDGAKNILTASLNNLRRDDHHTRFAGLTYADPPPRETITLTIDSSGGIVRLRITNNEAAAVFAATIQTYGFRAGHVEGRLISAMWDEVETPTQRIARGDTRALRLATLEQSRDRFTQWRVHRSHDNQIPSHVDGLPSGNLDKPEWGDDEVLDVIITADPELAVGAVRRRITLHPRVAEMANP